MMLLQLACNIWLEKSSGENSIKGLVLTPMNMKTFINNAIYDKALRLISGITNVR